MDGNVGWSWGCHKRLVSSSDDQLFSVNALGCRLRLEKVTLIIFYLFVSLYFRILRILLTNEAILTNVFMFYVLILFLQPLREAMFPMVWCSFNLHHTSLFTTGLLFNILRSTELKRNKRDICTVWVYNSIQQLLYKQLTYLKFRSTLPDLKILYSVSLMNFKLLNNMYVRISFLIVTEL